MQRDDWTLVTLEETDRTLLNFARKLNSTPDEMCSEDIDCLRAAGFADQNIFDVVVIVAYFNFMNRIADGFGIAPESWKLESYERHMREVMAAHRPAPATHPQ